MERMINLKTTLIIAAIVLVIGLVIYFAGKKAGKKCGWLDKLTGACADDRPDNKTIYVETGNGKWYPNQVTDTIYNAIHNHGIVFGNGEGINDAFAIFNALSADQKIAVVNDWRERIHGRDKRYWGTGDYGTLKAELEEFADDFQPQVELAYNWMNSNGIE